MDFLDPKKKRSHRIRLFIGYGLMTILITIGAMFLLFEASGFDVDPRTGQVIHNGLVFVDAQPGEAEVYLNDEHKGQTDKRLVIPADRYKLELRRDGYRTWQKTFVLNGSTIERFVYPLLIPEALKPQDSHLYAASPSFATQSPDRRWLVLRHGKSLTQLELLDISSAGVESKTITLPSGLLTASGSSHSLETIEWSKDSKHILIKHKFDKQTEFVMINHTAPASSINLNKTFSTSFTYATLYDKKPDQFYLLNETDGTLRLGMAKTGRTTDVLNKVIAYRSYGDNMLIYITDNGAKAGTAEVRIKEDDKTYKLRSLKKDKRYLFDLGRFDDKWYVAAGSPAENKIYVYQEPLQVLKNPTSLTQVPVPVAVFKTENQDFLRFSANNRFVSLQGGDKMFVYDVETDRPHRYDHNIKLAAKQEITWMDGHRFAAISEGKVVIFDYDGTNRHELVSASSSFTPFFDNDYDNMFTIGPSVVVPGRTALVKTSLLAD